MTLLAKLGALVVGFITNANLRILAFKYFIKALIIAVVPLIMLISFNLVFGELVDWIVAKVDAQTLGEFTAYQLIGLGSYLYIQLGLDVVLAVILSAYAVKMTLRAIPFLRL